jgi:hypothetical protein
LNSSKKVKLSTNKGVYEMDNGIIEAASTTGMALPQMQKNIKAADPKPVYQVLQTMEFLDTEIAMALGDLHSALRPVLTDLPESELKKGDHALNGSSGVHSAIATHNDKADSILQVIREITKRLEV